MKNTKLRTRITVRVGVLLILGGIFLNVIVKKIIDFNGNNVIKNDMIMQQNNTVEFINQYFIINNKALNKQNFINASYDIAIKLANNSNSTIGIYDDKGTLKYQMVKGQVDKSVHLHIDKAKKDKAYVFFSDEKNDYKGYFAYPLYSKNEFLGIVEIVKDYKDIITNNRNIYFLFSIVESILFFIILIFIDIIMKKSTKPIENLVNGVKEISKGNYGYEVIEDKNKDEISDLAYEYNKMRRKIKDQIEITHNLEKNRREFFCNITHELKTPLTSISGYAELLESNYNNELLREKAVESIIKESNKLNSMISNILEVARGQILNKERIEFDVGMMLEKLSQEMEIRNSNGIKVDLNIEYCNIIGIFDEIKSMLLNLLENAYKYSIEHGTIEILGTKKHDYYNIIISNESYRINGKFKEKAFEPFIRGENSNGIDGNGLGLYICKMIVEEHEGEIELDSLENVVKVNVKLKSL